MKAMTKPVRLTRLPVIRQGGESANSSSEPVYHGRYSVELPRYILSTPNQSAKITADSVEIEGALQKAVFPFMPNNH
jgi:hypothetical protein